MDLIVPAENNPGSDTGYSVALDGLRMMIGAPTGGSSGIGSVFFFDNPAIEVLTNSGFETDANSDNNPDNWIQQSPSSDQRNCAPLVAFEGNCAYEFQSGAGENSSLRQDVDFSPYTMSTGDLLIMDGYVKTTGLNINTNAYISVKYTDPGLPVDKVYIRFKSPTAGWVAIPPQTLILKGEPFQVRLFLKNLGTDGVVNYDAMSLKWVDVDGGESLIPLPSAAEHQESRLQTK